MRWPASSPITNRPPVWHHIEIVAEFEPASDDGFSLNHAPRRPASDLRYSYPVDIDVSSRSTGTATLSDPRGSRYGRR